MKNDQAATVRIRNVRYICASCCVISVWLDLATYPTQPYPPSHFLPLSPTLSHCISLSLSLSLSLSVCLFLCLSPATSASKHFTLSANPTANCFTHRLSHCSQGFFVSSKYTSLQIVSAIVCVCVCMYEYVCCCCYCQCHYYLLLSLLFCFLLLIFVVIFHLMLCEVFFHFFFSHRLMFAFCPLAKLSVCVCVCAWRRAMCNQFSSHLCEPSYQHRQLVCLRPRCARCSVDMKSKNFLTCDLQTLESKLCGKLSRNKLENVTAKGRSSSWIKAQLDRDWIEIGWRLDWDNFT